MDYLAIMFFLLVAYLVYVDRMWMHREMEVLRKATKLTEAEKADLTCMGMIHHLREQEGWMVELICDNPDFEGPNCVVGVFGDWPVGDSWAWVTRNFEGDSMRHCLQLAIEAKAKAQQAVYIPGR